MLQLDPMTQTEYEAYLATAVDDYALDTSRAWKRPLEWAQEQARKDYAELLPQGLDTPNNWLFTARQDGEAVGHAWLAVKDNPWGRGAAIYDIAIREAWRGKGLGRQLLEEVQRAATEQGATRIGLNVFGFNTVARSLYESAGFEIGGMGMVKLLSNGTE